MINDPNKIKILKKNLVKLTSQVNSLLDLNKQQKTYLQDTSTSLTLHKNIIVNMLKEQIVKEIELKQATESGTEILGELLMLKSENDELVDKLYSMFIKRQDLNKFLYRLSNSIEYKTKIDNAEFISLNDLCIKIETQIIDKKREVDLKVKDHDKTISHSVIMMKHEIYLNIPTKYNMELHVEKMQSVEIMDKLTILVNSEKDNYTQKQETIKHLTDKISNLKKNHINSTAYNTVVEDSYHYQSNIPPNINTGNVSKGGNLSNYQSYKSPNDKHKDFLPQYDSAISYKNVEEIENIEEKKIEEESVSLNFFDVNLDQTIDSQNINFPDKIRMDKLNYNSNFNTLSNNNCNNLRKSNLQSNLISSVPGLNFGEIHQKYKYDKSVVVKEKKIEQKTKNLKSNDQKLLSLLQNDNISKNDELTILQNQLNDQEDFITELKEKLEKEKNLFKSIKAKNTKLLESLEVPNERIKNLQQEIIEYKKSLGILEDKEPANKQIANEKNEEDEENDDDLDDVDIDIFDSNFDKKANGNVYDQIKSKLSLSKI